MSQVVFSSIDPAISGTTLATTLNAFKDALMSGLSGTSRPTQLQAGGFWVDTTNNPTSWAFKLWTGVDDVEVFYVDLLTGTATISDAVGTFTVRKVSADAVGAILELVKRRIATNGQVLNGDIVGQIRMVGRDNTGGDPVVAKIVYTADENQTTTAFGGTLTFYSTPAGSATITAHMRFLTGIIESIVPHKLNAQSLVSQNVSTAATIAQLAGDKVVVEMTGSTATDIQGINSGQASKVVTIHNRSSAAVTLKHENASAAAADRMTLPGSADVILQADQSATMFYVTSTSRWKVLYASSKFDSFSISSYFYSGTYSVPTTLSKIRLTVTRDKFFPNQFGGIDHWILDRFGNAYFMGGTQTAGAGGVGDVTPRSSPVAVLGGLKFQNIFSNGLAAFFFGLTTDGFLYSCGSNLNGDLGLGDVTARSSPVAVLGGLRFTQMHFLSGSRGLAEDGSMYAWGPNTAGGLGVGDNTNRSSPVAVLGGLRFKDFIAVTSAASTPSVLAITDAGAAYAWGDNLNGQLGVGDVIARSSPVAVLGSLSFVKVFGEGFGTFTSGFFFGLTSAGALYAWGINNNGQLGVGDVNPRSSPVAVLGGLTFSDVAVLRNSVVALTTAGVAYSWGVNTNGQLALGDVTPRSSPVAVLGGLTFKQISPAGDSGGTDVTRYYGLTTGNDLYAWGLNTDGQLGVGDVTPRSSPVAVLGGLKFFKVSKVLGSGKGLTTDGKWYAWGRNTSGQLGVGDVVPRSSPVAVLGTIFGDYGSDISYFDIPVTGGSSQNVIMGPGRCYFGTQFLGNGVTRIDIEYPS